MNWGKVIKKDMCVLGCLFLGIVFLAWLVAPVDYMRFIYFSIFILVCATDLSMESMFTKDAHITEYLLVKVVARLYKCVGIILVIGLSLDLLNCNGYDNLMLAKIPMAILEVSITLYLTGQEWKEKKVETIYNIILLVGLISVIVGNIIIFYTIKWNSNVFYIIGELIAIYVYIKFRDVIKELRPRVSQNTYYCSMMFVNIKLLNYIAGIILNIVGVRNAPFVSILLLSIGNRYLFEIIYYAVLEDPWRRLEKQLDELEEKIYYNAKDRNAIINLSHELKTPLNVIRSAIDLLKLDIDKHEEVYKDMMQIQCKCDKCIKLIRYMIDINKIKGGYISPKIEVYDMGYVVENVVEAYLVVYPDTYIILDILEEKQYVKVDLEVFQRVLFYLITIMSNCFSKDNPIELIVETISDENKVIVRFEHEDMGLIHKYQGISPKIEEKDVQYILMMNYIKHILSCDKFDIEMTITDNELSFIFKVAQYDNNELRRGVEENISDLIEQIRLDG